MKPVYTNITVIKSIVKMKIDLMFFIPCELISLKVILKKKKF